MADKLLKNLSTILICEDNRVALDEALIALKGSSRKPFPDASDVLLWAGDLDAKLAADGVAASNRVGCTYEYRGAGPSANAYKYAKAVIGFSLKRTAKGWFLTDAGTRHVYPKQNRIDRITLTEKARDAVVRTALAPYVTVSRRAA